MMDYHVVLGGASLVIQLIGFSLYIFSAFKQGTKPHPFTWLIFAIVDGTVFMAQLLHGGGPGAWLLGLTTVNGTILFLVALWKGERRIAKVDWVCLVTALIGIAAWYATGNALYAVILAAAVDIIARIPTVRKSYVRPHEESLSIWITGVLIFSLSIAALSSKTVITVLFPAEIVLMNMLMIGMILYRRRQLAAELRKG